MSQCATRQFDQLMSYFLILHFYRASKCTAKYIVASWLMLSLGQMQTPISTQLYISMLACFQGKPNVIPPEQDEVD